MKPGSTSSLWSQIHNHLGGQQQVKAIQSDQRCKHQQARIWPPYFEMRKFVDYLEKIRNINSECYIALSVFEGRNCQKTTTNEEKCSFTKTMHHVSSRSQQWQSYMNCTSNSFHTHPILQICPPATTGCLQTSKECSRERDLAPMKK